MKTRFERSAGGVVIRRVDGDVEVALASRRIRSGELKWGLPKGQVEDGEEPPDTALREVREETGLEARIVSDLGDISYWFVWDGARVRKEVLFYLMERTGGDFADDDAEMEEVRWFPLEEAAKVASFASEKEVIHRAAEALGGGGT